MTLDLADTSGLVGGPIKRYGAKGKVAHLLLPHFARARTYCEPCFGAGSVFYALPSDAYECHAVNDLDASIVTFFRVLRDRTEELVSACELTPYAREEFRLALERSDDPLEEARRVWVRSRQGFAGKARTVGDWGRTPGETGGWNPSDTISKLTRLRAYAARLRDVAIDCVDAAEFIAKWGTGGAFVYVDPSYVHESRTGRNDYLHEMREADHRRLAASCVAAVERGAKVAVSGYESALYRELFAGWRTVSVDVPLYGTRHAKGQRRTEVLWCSYPAPDALGYVAPDGPLFGKVRP